MIKVAEIIVPPTVYKNLAAENCKESLSSYINDNEFLIFSDTAYVINEVSDNAS